MSGAIAVTTAVIAIGVAAEVGTTFAIIAAVGATVGAVGAITGVKELKYAGMAIGAVGAIGGLAQSAGLFGAEAFGGLGEGAAAQAAGLASDVGFVAPAAGETMAGIVSSSGLPGAYAGMEAVNAGSGFAPLFDAGQYGSIGDVIDIVNGVNTTPVVDPMAAINPMADTNVAAGLPAGGNEQIAPGSSGTVGDAVPVDAAAGTGLEPPSASGTGLMGSANDPALTSTVTTVDPGVPGGAAAPTGAPTQTVAGVSLPPSAPVTGPNGMINLPAGTSTSVPAAWGGGMPDTVTAAQSAVNASGKVGVSGSSVWSDIMSTIGKPGVGTLLSGAVQAGGAFIAGATSTLTPAQIKALDAQAQQNLAATNLANQQAATLQEQQKKFAGPMPMAVKKPPPGLLNTPVTGAPA